MVAALSGPHVAKLVFLEVGGHPDVVQVDDLHQFLADLDILADFDRAIADDAADRSHQPRVLQIQVGLVQLGLLLLGLGLRRPGRATRVADICCGAVPAERKLASACSRLAWACDTICSAADGRCPGRGYSRGAGAGRGDRLVILLVRNFLLVHQLFVAADIVLRLDVIGDGLLQLGPRRLQLLARHRNSGACAFHFCLRRDNWLPVFTDVIGTFTCSDSAVASASLVGRLAFATAT